MVDSKNAAQSVDFDGCNDRLSSSDVITGIDLGKSGGWSLMVIVNKEGEMLEEIWGDRVWWSRQPARFTR